MSTAAWIEAVTPDDLDRDPYPTWARLRAEAPVCWVPWADLWFVTRWEDCLAVGADAEAFRGAKDHPTLERVFGAPNVLTAVDPEHRDLRDAVDPLLRPRAVNGYIDDLARPIVRRHVDALRGRGAGELMGDFFEPVSVEALGELLGLGVDAATLRQWFHGLNVGVANVESDPAKFATADAITAAIEERLDPLLERLAREPDGSMLSHMLHGGRDGEPRPASLVLPSLKVILLGGMQEPGHAAGSTLLGLLTRPEQLARVAADPKLVATAVTEGLRWIAPIGAVERQATRDVVIAGQEIAAGDIVEVILASANRDERRYERPDEYDIDRPRQSHMAFGNGDHFCSGHFFSRQLERIALEELLAALPGLRQDPAREPVVRGWAFRAPKQLFATWDA
ncbi:MAG TPA: cytochrome P450 [Solirubrobacteraceae bacterium]|nr:cytochrome P450 [Solirubrobacteraceae bacterium]